MEESQNGNDDGSDVKDRAAQPSYIAKARDTLRHADEIEGHVLAGRGGPVIDASEGVDGKAIQGIDGLTVVAFTRLGVLAETAVEILDRLNGIRADIDKDAPAPEAEPFQQFVASGTHVIYTGEDVTVAFASSAEWAVGIATALNRDYA